MGVGVRVRVGRGGGVRATFLGVYLGALINRFSTFFPVCGAVAYFFFFFVLPISRGCYEYYYFSDILLRYFVQQVVRYWVPSQVPEVLVRACARKCGEIEDKMWGPPIVKAIHTIDDTTNSSEAPILFGAIGCV